MKQAFSLDYKKQNKTKQLLGLSYGLLAGLAFIVAAWGIDAFQLGRASVDFFWLKLAIGGLAALLLGGLTGWLGEKIDNGLVTFVLWLITAFILARLASQLPFQIFSKAVAILDSNVQGLSVYPYPSNADRRMVIVYIVMMITGGLGGALQRFLVDSALGAATSFNRWMALCICIPFFFLAGNAVDYLNGVLRGPLVATHETLEFAKANLGKPVDKKLAADMGLHSVDTIQSLLKRPYRLILGTYEPDYLDSFTVYIDFDGEWATCSGLIDRLSNCELSQTVFLNKLNDLLTKGQDPAGFLQAAQPVEQWMAAWKEQGLRPVRLAIRDQRGTAVLVEVQDQNSRAYRCRLNVSRPGSILLEFCSPPGSPTIVGQNSQPVTPTVLSKPAGLTPAAASIYTFTFDTNGFVGQEVAMLPASEPDLQGLQGLAQYNLQLNVDFANHSFRGHSRVETTNHTSGSLDRLYFRLFPNGGRSYGNGFLKVSQVTQDGQPLQTSLSKDDSVLEVRLAVPLSAGARTGLDMDFSGFTPLNFGGGYGIYNYGDNVMTLANWYPILAVFDNKGWHLDPTTAIGDSVFSEMAYYTVSLTAPRELVVASTGVDIRRTDQDSTSTYLIASGPARDFFVAMSPDFSLASQQVGGTQVNSYYLSKDTGGGQKALQIAGKALQDYNGQFGLYPYRELDVVEAPLQDALGVEYPGIILAASSVYSTLSDETFTKDTTQLLPDVIRS
jgi:hypothetical protein